MRCSEPGGSVAVAIVASLRRVAELGSLGGMKLSRQSLSSALVALAAAMVLLGTLYFASRRPGYSHISNTISELGETGAAQAHLVAFGFFLPVGLIVWLALWLAHGHRSGQN